MEDERGLNKIKPVRSNLACVDSVFELPLVFIVIKMAQGQPSGQSINIHCLLLSSSRKNGGTTWPARRR